MSSGDFALQLYNNAAVLCPLCGQRKARRTCPALGQQICAICCGTKRLTEIRCPSDCAYLASAREHPAAIVVRQQQRDVGIMVHLLRDFSQRESRLFLSVNSFITRYQPPGLQTLIDDDVGEAAGALAATFETAARGVIYEHRPASLPAERLMTALKGLLQEMGQNGGTAFERDAAVVLRRIEEAVRDLRAAPGDNRRAYLDVLGRVLQNVDAAEDREGPKVETPRLIVP
jgi:hypothetical protein